MYESKYGNTKRVAKAITEGIREVESIEIELRELDEIDLDKVRGYDVILIGSSNHFGRPTRSIKKFIENIGKLGLKGKKTAAFDTYIGNDFEKAVINMEKLITEKASNFKLATSRLSIKVQGMKGPIIDEESSKCKEFSNRIGQEIV